MSSLSIISRIEWCRRQGSQAGTESEVEGWKAEETGLLDALLRTDHSNHYEYAHSPLFERYLMGFQDAQALLSLAQVERYQATGPR